MSVKQYKMNTLADKIADKPQVKVEEKKRGRPIKKK